MQIYSPSTAATAGLYLVWSVVNLGSTLGSLDRLPSFRAGWNRQPSFLSTKATSTWTSNSQWDELLLQTRGGSTEDDASTETTGEETLNSEADDRENNTTELSNTTQPLELNFSATVPNDGSETDPDGIPTRFLEMKKNNRDEAKEAFQDHLKWREEFQVGTVLARPHPKYDVCKAMVPHYFAGRDPHNNIVFVQRPAMVDFELMRRNNSTIDDLLLHYIYVIEYCWNILDPGHDKIMTNVLDMSGLSFRQMKNQEYIGFGKRFVNMMSANYPGRSYKTLVVNAPSWFHALYKIFKPLLRESTRQKIVILKAGEQQDTALKFYLGDSLPEDLISGAKDKQAEKEEAESSHRYFIPVEDEELCGPGPNSLMEFSMRKFCIEQLKLHNISLQEVL